MNITGFTDGDGSAVNETAAAVLAGLQAAAAAELSDGDGRFYLVKNIDGSHDVIDLDDLIEAHDERYGARPKRKTGTVYVQNADSFVAYIEKHGYPETEVYADLARNQLVGIINAHTGTDDSDLAGHRDHRVKLDLVHTDAWKAWLELDRKPMTQQAFAEHLEDRAIDVIDPDSATMLEVAQSLIATTGVDFKSANRLTDGQVQFRYEETTQARAGHGGELEIPTLFLLSIAPFEGCPPVELSARFRYRITPSGLQLFYALLNPADVARSAFRAYVDHINDELVQPVFAGRPE